MIPGINLDPTILASLATAPFLEQVIEYLKLQWKLPGKFAALTALVLGVIASEAIGVYMHNLSGVPIDYYMTAVSGLFTGFTTSYWHELSKKPTTGS